MGTFLVSVDTEASLHFSIWAWRNVLALAKQYGWEPLGTESLRETYDGYSVNVDDWNGNYLLNGGQLVRSEDTKAMAEALEIALADVCDSWEPEKREINDAIANDPTLKKLCEASGGQGSCFQKTFNQMARTSPLSFFRHAGREKLIEFIDFCKKGAFVIY